uniref:Uncharacterized protein n=1 Tax=Helicotheca tamesis TaxID=374047 RepID=A0A7S2HF85_9STRA|mmetsp:Transcript_17571/g.24217  ORF Transcript_17571/g.24217 Transcript_17571/m.24217 type:complete len:274 (+) Transcript_17571:262-1083(+)
MTEEICYAPEVKQKGGTGSSSIAKIFAIHDHNKSCDINYHVDLQRSCMNMLKSKDGDIFYSRTDLRILIEKTEHTIYKELCNHHFFSNTLLHHHNATSNGVQDKPNGDFVVHAAARLSLKPENLQQILSSFPTHLFHIRDMFNFGVIPLHIAASYAPPTTGAKMNNHTARVKLILSAFPLGAKYLDLRGRLPLHHALLHGADAEVITALIKANPNSLSLPFLPTESETNEISSMKGFLPFHMSCCLDLSCSAIFVLIQNNPSCVCGYDMGIDN